MANDLRSLNRARASIQRLFDYGNVFFKGGVVRDDKGRVVRHYTKAHLEELAELYKKVSSEGPETQKLFEKLLVEEKVIPPLPPNYPSTSKPLAKYLNECRIRNTIKLTPVVKNVSSWGPGDFLMFHYTGPPLTKSKIRIEPVVLVVGCQRGPQGFYVSTRGNPLVSCYRVSHLSPEVFKFLAAHFYGKKSEAYYNKIQGALDHLIGKAYRTFNLHYIHGYNKIQLSKRDIDRYKEEIKNG